MWEWSKKGGPSPYNDTPLLFFKKKISHIKWYIKCVFSQVSSGSPRNEVHQSPDNEIRGEYDSDEVTDLSQVMYVPVAIWVRDDSTGKPYEMPAAFPKEWFSTCFKYVRIPGGAGWFPTYDQFKKSLGGFGTKALETKFKKALVAKRDPEDWYERDVSRFLGAYGCKLVYFEVSIFLNVISHMTHMNEHIVIRVLIMFQFSN